MAETTTQVVQNVSQERLPPELVPYYLNLMDAAQTETGRPYAPYGAQRLAGFTEPEVAAQQGLTALGLSQGPIQQQMATQAAGSAYGGLDSLLGGMGDYPRYDQQTISSYMDPYHQSVIDARTGEAARQAARQMANLKMQAAQQGAFGGYGMGLAQQGLMRDLFREQDSIVNQGKRDAYQNALGLIQSDRDETYRRAGLGVQGYQTQGGLASLLGGLGAQEQQMQFERLGALQGVGEQQRALQQAGYDMGYQDYLRQYEYPKNQLNFMSSILRGLPYMGMDRTDTTSTMQKNPGLFQTMVGTGIAGLGLYNAYNQ